METDGPVIAPGDAPASAVARRDTLLAAVSALEGLSTHLWQIPGVELEAWVTLVDRLGGLAAGARVALAVEAQQRGEIAASQAGSVTGWLTRSAPGLAAAGGVGAVALVVGEAQRPAARALVDAVVSGSLAAPVAVTITGELERLRPRLMPEAVPTVLAGMIEVGRGFGSRGVRELRARIVAEHGRPGELDAIQESVSGLVALSHPVGDELGMFSYRLTTDPVGKAVLEAAIGPLARPLPEADGTPDRRRAATRRAQALIEVCRRATAAGGAPPQGPKATLMLTMSLSDLQSGLRVGTALGSSEAGTLLAPGVVRRVACEAGVAPVVLGTESEVLDLGRTARLFVPGQLKALWLRDRVCTFPGCGMPAHWCDAHHVLHWLDGGPTAVGNAALLCGRHHTVVHRDRLIASVGPTGVEWDTVPGSYDRALAGRPPRWRSHGVSEVGGEPGDPAA